MGALVAWLQDRRALHERLALVVPPSAAHAAGAKQFSQGTRCRALASELAEDALLEGSCRRAFEAAQACQLAQPPTALDAMYLAERPALVSRGMSLAAELQLPDEVAFDAVLLMDRVMSTGAEHNPALGSLVVAAALRVRRVEAAAGDAVLKAASAVQGQRQPPRMQHAACQPDPATLTPPPCVWLLPASRLLLPLACADGRPAGGGRQ